MAIGDLIEKAVAGKWIAGESINDAIDVAKKLNAKGVAAMINYLGEDLKKEEEVNDAMRCYRSLIFAASAYQVRTSIAVKPTQIGLTVSKKTANKNYSELAALARKYGIFVWLDMEAHEYVDDTIDLYNSEVRNCNVGICIQSYLRRSQNDIKSLVKKGGVIRLVKGAYREDVKIAYANRAETTKNYSDLMKYLFKNSRHFMIATHDEGLIKEALELKKGHKAHVSFAMLNGIRNEYAFKLAKKREDVSVYVPFGGRWVSYGYRRLKELENSKLILRSLLGSHS